MTDEKREEIDETELEETNGEELPAREQMSIVTPPGESLTPPPTTE